MGRSQGVTVTRHKALAAETHVGPFSAVLYGCGTVGTLAGRYAGLLQAYLAGRQTLLPNLYDSAIVAVSTKHLFL